MHVFLECVCWCLDMCRGRRMSCRLLLLLHVCVILILAGGPRTTKSTLAISLLPGERAQRRLSISLWCVWHV